MSRSVPPFRADHVGSLLRPAQLLAAREDFAAGRIDASRLRAIEDEAITAVVAMQREVGLQAVTDGEFRRALWHMDVINQIGGIGRAPGNMAVRFRNASGDIEWTPAALHVDSKIVMTKTIFGDHFEYLKSVAAGLVPKLTIPSPNMVHYRGGPAAIDPAVYPDPEEFWHDLSAAYADEVARLGRLGCTYLQFDDTSLAYLNDCACPRSAGSPPPWKATRSATTSRSPSSSSSSRSQRTSGGSHASIAVHMGDTIVWHPVIDNIDAAARTRTRRRGVKGLDGHGGDPAAPAGDGEPAGQAADGDLPR